MCRSGKIRGAIYDWRRRELMALALSIHQLKCSSFPPSQGELSRANCCYSALQSAQRMEEPGALVSHFLNNLCFSKLVRVVG